uniref:Uncharacterized protein n=1 Tax=Anopheles farauti TaxID=69004 RepID=A0A182QAG3_9DIPT
MRGNPRPRPRNTFPFAGGLFGRSASIRSVQPVVGHSSNAFAYSSLLKFELTAFGSRIFEWPGESMFVRIQQMSSHRRKPHLRRQLRPMSSPSELPHHRNTKLRWAATSPISSASISSHDQKLRGAPAATAAPPRAYSSSGGSIKITSNLVPSVFRSNVLRSARRYMGGVAVSAISSSFRRISSRSFGYSSNRSAKPTSRMKF